MPPYKSSTIVHKFGGAALADAAAITNVGNLLAADTASRRRIVVTSALFGMTNQLLKAIEMAAADVTTISACVEAVRERHHTVITQLFHDAPETIAALTATLAGTCETLTSQLHAVAQVDGRRDELSDAIVAHGERLAAQIVMAMLQRRGIASAVVDGTALIVADGRHGNAAPNLERTDVLAAQVLEPLLAKGILIIVPGFIGAGPDGTVVTLGRGGSDLSAAVLARALNAREANLWKDVAGCMTADPRIVQGARVIPELDAREASELAYYGANILHPRALFPLRSGMTLRIRPFADPGAHGTSITVGKVARGAPVRAISGIASQAMVSINGTGMLGVPGVAARVFGALATLHVSVSMISQASSEQSICFTIPSGQLNEVTLLLNSAFAEEIARGEVDEISGRGDLTTIAVVGSGMARTPGIAARIFNAVSHAHVNIVAIAQGSSERNISFVVDQKESAAAVQAVHAAFRLDKVGGGRAGRRAEHTDIILLGMGRVAQEFVTQFLSLSKTGGHGRRIVGIIDRSGCVFNLRGLPARQLASLVVHKQTGGALKDAPGARAMTALEAVNFMSTHALNRPVLVDAASGDTGPALASAVSHGIDLVLANKVPLASAMSASRAIMQEARANGRKVLHEATVGAGLPVIDTLQQLHASGDRVDSVDSSPSGTMGFLFSEMGRGRKFSEAVREAMARGYTEPDPRDDLCGLDVARKGIILARMLGYTGEMSDVSLESLVPESLRDVSLDEFLEKLPECDAPWEQRIADARDRGEVLRYRARATRGGVRVGLASVPLGSALASLDGTDNLFVFTTARYRERPLVVSGPGAGVAVTAAGVLGDVLRLTAA